MTDQLKVFSLVSRF